MLVRFDVAKVTDHLPPDGRRDISAPVWTYVVVEIEMVWRDPLLRAQLTACQFAGARGMVINCIMLIEE